MQVKGEHVDVRIADGATLACELFTPPDAGPHPGVVVLHESFGLNDDIRRIARRFAAAGYAALAPDLYSHGSRIVCLSRVMVDLLRGSLAREIDDILAAVTRSRRDPRSIPSGLRWPASVRAVGSP